MFFTLFYFILALLLLVTIHEYGHFIVARWCGVKVLRFSFGFGKVLFSWQGKKGTEYSFSLFPLGGYVKMLDESEGPVKETEKHLAFNNQAVWKRMAIVLAGPLFNFLFAFLALWFMLMIGITSLAPIVDSVTPNSIASQAGIKANQEILKLNQNDVNSWRDFQYHMMPFIGTKESIPMLVKSLKSGELHNLYLPLKNWQLSQHNTDLLKSLGIEPFVPKIPPIVGQVVKDSPAALAGIKPQDEIIKVDDKHITDWLFLVNYVKNRPNQAIELTIKRGDVTHTKRIVTGRKEQNGQISGFVGMSSKKMNWPAGWLRVTREAPLQAFVSAGEQTWELTSATFKLIGRLVTAKLPMHTISGPVGIAQGAGDSARNGLPYYLFFLAIVSISLGVLNLLPIPMLDGGHLLYYLIEVVRARPVSDEAKSASTYVGLVLLVAMMIIAFTNDITRIMHS